MEKINNEINFQLQKEMKMRIWIIGICGKFHF